MKKGDLKSLRPDYQQNYTRNLSERSTETVTPTDTDVKVWEKKMDIQVKGELLLDDNLQIFFSIILEQCTEALVQNLKGHDTFDDIHLTSHLICLLKLIREKMFKMADSQWLLITIHQVLHQLFLFSQ